MKAAGLSPEPMLREAGLTLRQVCDLQVRLKVRDQIKFLNLAAQALEDEFLGFHLAQDADLRELGLLYYVLASSQCLADALERAARYSSIVNEGIAQECLTGGRTGMSFNYVGVNRYHDRHQIEFWTAAVVGACRQLTGRRILPSRVRFVHLRKRRCAAFAETFGKDIKFGAGVDEITFAAGVGRLPVIGADPYLNRLLVGYCEEALSQRPGRSGSFRARVENAIVPLLPHGKIQVAEIASRLGVSKRTFARRLSSEGLSFSKLLESLRSDLADRYLADEDLSISQIAWLLGYKEIGAFSRAFKHWTGKTPREARSHISS
jgi:AraC-like DNA-binding protein